MVAYRLDEMPGRVDRTEHRDRRDEAGLSARKGHDPLLPLCPCLLKAPVMIEPQCIRVVMRTKIRPALHLSPKV
jgi:hypothetical protein